MTDRIATIREIIGRNFDTVFPDSGIDRAAREIAALPPDGEAPAPPVDRDGLLGTVHAMRDMGHQMETWAHRIRDRADEFEAAIGKGTPAPAPRLTVEDVRDIFDDTYDGAPDSRWKEAFCSAILAALGTATPAPDWRGLVRRMRDWIANEVEDDPEDDAACKELVAEADRALEA